MNECAFLIDLMVRLLYQKFALNFEYGVGTPQGYNYYFLVYQTFNFPTKLEHQIKEGI